MALMSVVVVLGKPCILHSKPIGELDQFRHFIQNLSRRLVPRSFDVISQSDLKQAQVLFFC
jgi:hypothetical protein